MYFYDPYGPRPSGRYYRTEDDLEPVFPGTECPNTIFSQELSDQVYEGVSPLDLLDLGNPKDRNITLNGVLSIQTQAPISSLPQPIEKTQIVEMPIEKQVETQKAPQEENKMTLVLEEKQPEFVSRKEVVDQFSDFRVNSMFMDSSQTVDDGIEHPGYTTSDSELTPDNSYGISTMQPPSDEQKEVYGDTDETQTSYHPYNSGGQQISEGSIQDSQPNVMSDGQNQQDEQKPSTEEKKSGIPTWVILGGAAALALFLASKK